jgi:hypothetical protein
MRQALLEWYLVMSCLFLNSNQEELHSWRRNWLGRTRVHHVNAIGMASSNFVAGPRLSMAENSMSKMQIYIEQQYQKEPEGIPIRGGRGFETKFYGASNSTSLISYV